MQGLNPEMLKDTPKTISLDAKKDMGVSKNFSGPQKNTKSDFLGSEK